VQSKLSACWTKGFQQMAFTFFLCYSVLTTWFGLRWSRMSTSLLLSASTAR
jgi:hypothetical protein